MFKIIKKWYLSIKKKLKNRYNYGPNIIHDILLLLIAILSVIFVWLLPVLAVLILIFMFIVFLSNRRLLNQAKGNGIIYGGRGKGKGLLLNYIIRKDKTNPYCNVEYGKAELLKNPSEYFDSIDPITIENFIDDTIDKIPKLEKFEKRNVYIDDVNVYMPNWADSLLKKKYESMPPFLAINRHLYDAYCIITTQDFNRPYKILRELQTDFSIKAINSKGFGFIWNCIPILRYVVYTKYIYHEIPTSNDKLPFDPKNVIGDGVKHAYLTSGTAIKAEYQALYGVIAYGRLFQFKKYLDYDTRYFHQLVYGEKAPK